MRIGRFLSSLGPRWARLTSASCDASFPVHRVRRLCYTHASAQPPPRPSRTYAPSPTRRNRPRQVRDRAPPRMGGIGTVFAALHVTLCERSTSFTSSVGAVRRTRCIPVLPAVRCAQLEAWVELCGAFRRGVRKRYVREGANEVGRCASIVSDPEHPPPGRGDSHGPRVRYRRESCPPPTPSSPS